MKNNFSIQNKRDVMWVTLFSIFAHLFNFWLLEDSYILIYIQSIAISSCSL